MQTEKIRTNIGFQIVAVCDLPDKGGLTERQIVVGRRIGSEIPDYVTWEYSKQGQYNFGHYDLDETEAYTDMVKRACKDVGVKTYD